MGRNRLAVKPLLGWRYCDARTMGFSRLVAECCYILGVGQKKTRVYCARWWCLKKS